MSRCPDCPVDPSDVCVGGTWCKLAASGDEVVRRHIVARSAMGGATEAVPEPAKPCKGCKPPSLLEKAGHFVVAIAGHALDGFTTIDPTERLAICANCEHRSADGLTCNQCGCGPSTITGGLPQKATWASEVCPLGKWPPPASNST